MQKMLNYSMIVRFEWNSKHHLMLESIIYWCFVINHFPEVLPSKNIFLKLLSVIKLIIQGW